MCCWYIKHRLSEIKQVSKFRSKFGYTKYLTIYKKFLFIGERILGEFWRKFEIIIMPTINYSFLCIHDIFKNIIYLYLFFHSDLFTVVISGEGLATCQIHGMCIIVVNLKKEFINQNGRFRFHQYSLQLASIFVDLI